MKDIVIIGGGAAGMIAAIFAARNGNKVIILEKNSICGKKILVTGNGRCNYFNEDQDIKHYRSSDIDLVKKVITKSNQDKILEFFRKIGIEPKVKNGYYYPFSNQAVSVQNALITEMRNLSIEVKENYNVQKVEKQNRKFIIYTDQESICCEKVIIATGSKSAPKTGSDGIGYTLCEKLGHATIKPLPALVSLKINEKYLKEWNGIRADVAIQSYEDNKRIDEEIGEIQLTDYGISGICVMNLSGRIARGLDKGKEEYVKINFLNGLNIKTEEDFIIFMNKRSKYMKNRNINEMLEGIINYKLVNVLVKKSKLEKNKKWNRLSNNEKRELAKNIVNFEAKIESVNTFEKSQVCSGGIPLREINLDTMESLKSEGLYIVGELLDVDGKCGGYNLTWAWISGMIAGKNIGVENRNDKN
ncbi:MAG: aminoacetone oxidase family FAD-binding enzyme [Clostridia bacterium]|nr:aminoacetone oxidase family FAD-binding enzyme [Clostridia bacterium]